MKIVIFTFVVGAIIKQNGDNGAVLMTAIVNSLREGHT